MRRKETASIKLCKSVQSVAQTMKKWLCAQIFITYVREWKVQDLHCADCVKNNDNHSLNSCSHTHLNVGPIINTLFQRNKSLRFVGHIQQKQIILEWDVVRYAKHILMIYQIRQKPRHTKGELKLDWKLSHFHTVSVFTLQCQVWVCLCWTVSGEHRRVSAI